MAVQLKDCKNCEQPFDEAYEFCPHCGQKDKDDLTIGVLFYNTIANYFSFDARFFKSFFPLLTKPGYLARKFIEGKRLLYLHPAQMYLFIAIVFFFLNSFRVNRWSKEIDANLAKTLNKEKIIDTITGNATIDSINTIKLASKLKQDSIDRVALRKALEENKFLTGMAEKQIDSIVEQEDFNEFELSFGSINKKLDSLMEVDATDEAYYEVMGLEKDAGAFKKRIYEQGLKFYKLRKAGGFFQTFFDTIPIAMFFVLPLFALILKLFYRKRGSYAHHLVFSFYYFSFLFTVFSLILLVNFIVEVPDWIDWLLVFSTFIYLVFALKRFYIQGWFKSFFKASMVTMFFFPVVVAAGLVVLGFAFMLY